MAKSKHTNTAADERRGPTMTDIERLTKRYADAREALADTVGTLQKEIDVLKRQYRAAILRGVGRARNAEDALAAAIDDAPHLFERPRSVILHGVRVGYQKGRGEIRFDDAAQVVRLIDRHFPDRADELVKTTRSPLKGPLSRLSAAELKRIGATVEETGDRVLVKPADSDIDKLVDALLDAAAADKPEEVA